MGGRATIKVTLADVCKICARYVQGVCKMCARCAQYYMCVPLEPWRPLATLGDPWRPLAINGDMPENGHFENSENRFVGFFYQFPCRVKRAKRLNEKPDFGTG